MSKVTPGGYPIPGWDGPTSPHGGDVGGDYQDGPSWVRRWVERNPEDNTFTVIDFYCFRVEQPDPDTYHGGEVGKLGMSVMVSYSECLDLGDVGGSEVFADIRYWDGIIENHHENPEAVLATLGWADIQSAHDQLGGN
jgi:hypothetical protein